MFCSTIIPTIGRPTLSRAVESLLQQDIPDNDYEIIIVNDSGTDLTEGDWQRHERLKVISTNCRERSVARNTGAALAKGNYLHFLDDDDWLTPGALRRFYELSQKTSTGWLYGSSQLVDQHGRSLIRLEHGLQGNCFIQVLAGEWIPLQASLIKTQAFFDVGGFNPRLAGPEDIDLLRRISLTEDLAGFTEVAAYLVRNDPNTTTDYARHPELSRLAREEILDKPAVFNRMWASASSGYWRGRVVRAYTTSVVWNLLHERAFTAASRAVYGLVGLGLSGRHIFSEAFWRAIAHPYTSETFARGLQEAGMIP